LPRGALGEGPEVRGGSRRIVDGRKVGIAANKHQIGAEPLHHVEFAFREFEIVRPLRLRHRLEIPERLKGRDRQIELAADPPRFGRVPSNVMRSFSKSSTPLNPTDAAASSFSGRVPASETVAIERGNGNGAGRTTPSVQISRNTVSVSPRGPRCSRMSSLQWLSLSGRASRVARR
jgi:hypothetical protein